MYQRKLGLYQNIYMPNRHHSWNEFSDNKPCGKLNNKRGLCVLSSGSQRR